MHNAEFDHVVAPDELMDGRGAVTRFRTHIGLPVDDDRHRRVFQRQVRRLVPSRFVFEMNTDESRSKVSLPSGFGYVMGLHCEAGLSIS